MPLGGARRIELCSALAVGGLTPSVELLKQIKLAFAKDKSCQVEKSCQVYCLIRCRPGGAGRN